MFGQVLADDAREVLDAGIQAFELGPLVEQSIGKAIADAAQLGFDFDDIGEVAVLVEPAAVEAQLEHVVVGMQGVFGAPITTDQVVLGDDIRADGHGVHGAPLSMMAQRAPMLQRVVVVGSLNMDLVVEAPRLPGRGETVLGGRLRTAGGGKGANQAVAAARLGARVSMVGCLGDDGYGRELRRALRGDGVGVRQVRRVAAPTGVALIVVGPDGENLIAVASGANALVTPADVSAARTRLERADVIVAQLEVPLETRRRDGGCGAARGRAVRAECGAGQVLSNELLRRVSVLVVNEVELAMLVGQSVAEGDEAAGGADASGDRSGGRGGDARCTRGAGDQREGHERSRRVRGRGGRYDGRRRRVRRGAGGALSRARTLHGCGPLRVGGGRAWPVRGPAPSRRSQARRSWKRTPRGLVSAGRSRRSCWGRTGQRRANFCRA